MKTASFIWSTEIYEFRKLPLDQLISDVFQSFRTLFDYALNKRAVTFEAEFVKYFHLSDQKTAKLSNCLQVTNCWV